MPALAPHVERMPRSGIREIMDLVWTVDAPVIGLHVGEPSFETPEHIRQAACEALTRGETRYTPNRGIARLREVIATKVRHRNGFTVEPSQVIVTAGGMQALHLALTATVAAEDEVLIPDPGWPNFSMAARLLQARPVYYQLHAEDSFLPEIDHLTALVTARTRALIVNSPSNPLGSVIGAERAETLCRFADEHDLWIISDECYDALCFEREHVSLAAHDREGRVLSCYSFSKTYAMTGLRVGYLVVPERFADAVAKLQEPLISCVSAPMQRAALAALEGPQECVDEMRSAYRARRDAAARLLDSIPCGYLLPQGAFYQWVDVRDYCAGDVAAWARQMLLQRHVAVAPGTAFGEAGQGWIRVSLATATDQLLEGLDRILADSRAIAQKDGRPVREL